MQGWPSHKAGAGMLCWVTGVAHHRHGPSQARPRGEGRGCPTGGSGEQELDAPRWAGRESGGCRTARSDRRGRGRTPPMGPEGDECRGNRKVHLGVFFVCFFLFFLFFVFVFFLILFIFLFFKLKNL